MDAEPCATEPIDLSAYLPDPADEPTD